ncbi:MAG: glutamate synthase-related protein [Pseudomonadota bacterium]
MYRQSYNAQKEYSSCGVGFITNKKSIQTRELIEFAHQALCKIPHRGGMSAEGIGDGAGVNIDISLDFFRHICNDATLELGEFGVANFFFPIEQSSHSLAHNTIIQSLESEALDLIHLREIEVDNGVINAASQKNQLPIHQYIFKRPAHLVNQREFEAVINKALLAIEEPAFNNEALSGFYPLSMSSYTQVYKGRLNSWEVMPYFRDLMSPFHKIRSLFFHTRFSTNTAPNPIFAQPFRRMAHNGELNTDKKNRLSEDAIARSNDKKVVFPKGQSDSARLDQTLARRITEDDLDIITAIVAMMPPAWENDESIDEDVKAMLEYFSLSEEKNDGPAALVFSDGIKIGARLDRLGLRPLRTVETNDYLAVMSEAGQIDFPPKDVISRGRIEAGGMIVFDHAKKEMIRTEDVLARMAKSRDFRALVKSASIYLQDLEEKQLTDVSITSTLNMSARHAAYSMNQESFKFMLDPMLQTGLEKISAMGYGVAPNALAPQEGGMSRFFSQRFAQVTNPPLDSLREVDGMTLRVALGKKAHLDETEDKSNKQIVLNSPVLQPQQLLQIQSQKALAVKNINTLFKPDTENETNNQTQLLSALDDVCDLTERAARDGYGLIVLSDKAVSHANAALPALLTISAVNQRLIKTGLRFHCSVVYETGQASSTHDIACLLGFGASAVSPLTVYHRCIELYEDNAQIQQALNNFQKAVEKALMKTMGKFGLCTVESYIGGEFFESNFLDTQEPILNQYFPNIDAPVGGVLFADIAKNAALWHGYVHVVQSESDIPLLGLFKERNEGAGHAFGNTAVREYINMTEEDVAFANKEQIDVEGGVILPDDKAYLDTSFEARTPEQINNAVITPAYRSFVTNLLIERDSRPATLRDILNLPCDFSKASSKEEFEVLIKQLCLIGNNSLCIVGLTSQHISDSKWKLTLCEDAKGNTEQLSSALSSVFGNQFSKLSEKSTSESGSLGNHSVLTNVTLDAQTFVSMLVEGRKPIALSEVQPAAEITATLASGAMSHGALVAIAHEAVAQGTNIAGAMSNSGEGGENSRRYNSVKASKIKQFASGRFGVWTGYLADPALQEIEIKIAQGAKPGEGGQLPSAKVNVEIAAARGGTPGVELVSPPPHHDTYSIEDLAQLIHDAKAARVKVIVKLVSSEGVGTIAVGVAKAGADVINIAGNTGGTGAAQVTSLKHTGRAADIGISEVHQALSENGLRDKVVLRCSNAHQVGLDVVKSAILGGDSFEFGTTALMMLKCVMAKNCNIKCPAGLTTNPEVYQGDARALAQYFINLAHDVREILASIGYHSLSEIRGQTHLLNMIRHPKMVGQLNLTGMLRQVEEIKIEKPVYLEADFTPDDAFIESFKQYIDANNTDITIDGPSLNNCNKSVGGQFSIDVERILNYQLSDEKRARHPRVRKLSNNRVVLEHDSVLVKTRNSAGQSYGAFNNSGIAFEHSGTCNDGVGKGAAGGKIVVKDPYAANHLSSNVLVGNFALFGATGGQLYINGQAGDRFGVRNSGAVAVVEGVGDFCCEYMTNGSILNLGEYGKGFGNGMSGGTAYQYDPNNVITNACSQDSVRAFSLSDDSELAKGQEVAVLHLLKEHINTTGSTLASKILADWRNEKRHFYFLIPLSLLRYQRSSAINKLMTRKAMLDELSAGLSMRYLRQVQAAYASLDTKGFLFNGQVPDYGECDSPLIFKFLIAAGVLRRALEAAQKAEPANADKIAKKLIRIEDKKLVDLLTKDMKDVLSNYSDEALSAILADKRLNDYKESLRLREVWDTQAYGTSVWIMDRNRQNQQELSNHLPLELALARYFYQLFTVVVKQTAA